MKDTTRALRELRRARKTGAPFTKRGHPLNPALRELEKRGKVRSRRIGNKTFWSEIDE